MTQVLMAQRQLSNQLVMMKKTDDFSSVFSFRRRYSTHFIVVHYRPNNQQQNGHETSRVGFVIAKKVAKQAVKRNYMRRVLRELCREHLSVFETSHVDLVIQVIKPFNRGDFVRLKEDLVTLFVRIQRKMAQD